MLYVEFLWRYKGYPDNIPREWNALAKDNYFKLQGGNFWIERFIFLFVYVYIYLPRNESLKISAPYVNQNLNIPEYKVTLCWLKKLIFYNCIDVAFMWLITLSFQCLGYTYTNELFNFQIVIKQRLLFCPHHHYSQFPIFWLNGFCVYT